MTKVVVAMSGGVDSSVSAYLLKKEGYDVVGATMRLIDDEKTETSIKDAKDVCNALGIEHFVFDLREEFKNIVIKNFIDSYKEGRTPNPCCVCNKYFKFGLFYSKAKELGCDFISTGHYAKVVDGKLYRADDLLKDQSYFLYGIDKEVLKHVIFPLEHYPTKEKVREIAEDAGLSVSKKKDSQEVCFVPNDDYKKFLVDKGIKGVPGDIEFVSGEVLGKHTGLTNYTIGQRKGLNISYNEPVYVVDIDTKNNKLIVGRNSDLMKSELIAGDVNLLVSELPAKVFGKVRSRSYLFLCDVFIEGDTMRVKFHEEQRAITKGQSIVLYSEDDICLGGGIIKVII